MLKSRVRTVGEEANGEGIVDSGANVGVTSFDVARFYKRAIIPFSKPISIHGVGDSVLESTHFADFGPVLGRFALLQGKDVSTLISISNITERGYTVEYTSGGVNILFNGKLVTQGRFDPESRLWYLDIGELLMLSERDDATSPLHALNAHEWDEFTRVCALLGQSAVHDVNEDALTELVSKAPRRKSRRGEIIPVWLVEAVFDLHNRMGHPSAKVMAKAIDHCMWIGVHPAITPAVVNKIFEKRHCIACEIGKMRHLVVPVGSGVKEIAVGHTISWDVCGKISPATINNAVYMFVFVCCATGFFKKFLTRNKTAETAEKCLREVVSFFRRYGHTVRRLKFDRGSVENSAHIDDVMAELKIEALPAAVETQRMNTIERHYQTFKDRVGTNMACQNWLPATAWGHGASQVEETLNCCPNELTHPCTPFELVTGERPDVGRRFKFAFGCPLKCFDDGATGFTRGQLAISLGYGAGNGACYVVIPGQGLRLFERYDVAPLKVALQPMSEATQRSFEPVTDAEGNITMRSPLAQELQQDCLAFYDQRRLEPHPSISTIDPLAVHGTAISSSSSSSSLLSSSSTGLPHRQHSPSSEVLNDVQAILQRAWGAVLKLVTDRGEVLESYTAAASEEGNSCVSADSLAGTPAVTSELLVKEHHDGEMDILSSNSMASASGSVSFEGDEQLSTDASHQHPVPAAATSADPLSDEQSVDLTVDKPVIPTTARRSQLRKDYSEQLGMTKGKRKHTTASAMESRILEMTEVRPPPLAFVLSARRLTTADIQRSLTPPMVRQTFGRDFRSDLTFDENVAAFSGSSTSQLIDLDTSASRRRAACLVRINAARATRQKQYDTDNPSLTRGLEDDPDNWRPAIEKEFDDLRANDVGTKIRIEEVPQGRQILNMMIILKIKRDAAGAYLKHKARVVVLGNQERKSLSEETFAPTASEHSVMLLFSLAASLGLSVRGFDVTAAFTYAELQDPVYVRLPSQFNEEGKPVIWRLNKSLYGLRRAPRHWFDKFTVHLIAEGYRQSPFDPCVFTKREGTNFIHAALHVDDVISVSNNEAMQRELAEKMKQHFKLTESDSLENVLGFHINYNPDGSLLLSQPLAIQRAIETMFGEAGETEITEAITPMSATFNDLDQDSSPACDKTAYLQIVGQLIWICRTRPDIAFAVNRLSTRSSKCTEKDNSAAKRVVRYLKFTRQLGLTFRPATVESDEAVRLVAWADAAYCVHQDSRSHSGICFALGEDNGKFMSKSSKQSTVTLSSCESELVGGVEATKTIMWLRDQLEFLGHEQREPTTLFADNTSMITLASNFSGQSKRMKHSLQKVHFMMEQVQNSVVRLAYMRTEDHTADILTKPLPPLIHWHHLGPLLGETPTIARAKEDVFRLKGRAVCMVADIVIPDHVKFLVQPSSRVVRFSDSIDRRIYDLERPSSAVMLNLPVVGTITHNKRDMDRGTPAGKKQRSGKPRVHQCVEFKKSGWCPTVECPFLHDERESR